MKRLYLSDLDGTLFTTDKKLTAETAGLLNECIAEGALFAVATARMPYGCDQRLTELHLNTLSILTNGVFLYDFSEKKYLSVKRIPAAAAQQALDAFARFRRGVFLYTFSDNRISIHYNDPGLVSQTQYYSDRALEACKEVAFEERLDLPAAEGDAVYLACTGPEKELEPVKDALSQIKGIACAFYLNIYNGLYCLEVFSDQASKRNALYELKEILGCDEVVVFGDNLNDRSMFEAAERCYAVENGLDEVKRIATGIIPGCNENGVAEFIHREVFGL